MKAKNPFDPLINQIADLLKYFEKGERFLRDEDMTPELEAKLEAIKELTARFREMTDKALQASGVNPGSLRTPSDKQIFTPEQKRFFEQLSRLEAEVEVRRRRAQVALAKKEAEESPTQDKLSKRRKRQIRKLGGSGWQPV